jgi:hypothetical protein
MASVGAGVAGSPGRRPVASNSSRLVPPLLANLVSKVLPTRRRGCRGKACRLNASRDRARATLRPLTMAYSADETGKKRQRAYLVTLVTKVTRPAETAATSWWPLTGRANPHKLEAGPALHPAGRPQPRDDVRPRRRRAACGYLTQEEVRLPRWCTPFLSSPRTWTRRQPR